MILQTGLTTPELLWSFATFAALYKLALSGFGAI
jgi:hypothetical protein